MSKSESNNQTIDVKVVQQDIDKQIDQVYNKFNHQLAKLLGPQLKRCIENNMDDLKKMTNCYDQFKLKIDPSLEKLGLKRAEQKSTLQKCLQSKQNAKVCAKVGLQKSNEYIKEAFKDFKNFLA